GLTDEGGAATAATPPSSGRSDGGNGRSDAGNGAPSAERQDSEPTASGRRIVGAAGRRIDRHDAPATPVARPELTDDEPRMPGDLFAILEEHADDAAIPIDRDQVERAFV